MKKIDILIMGFLRNHKMHGYQILKIAKERHFLGWAKMKQSTIYKELNSLEQKKLIESNRETIGNNPPRKVYSITDVVIVEFQKKLKKFVKESLKKPDRDFIVGISFLENSLEKEFVREMLEKRISVTHKLYEKISKKKNKHIKSGEIKFPKTILFKYGIKHIQLGEQLIKEILENLDNDENKDLFTDS
ncbi:MAG: PadR family transcriptional regulator [Candidatus Cloacimonadota bacterium]|nr:PadR family transcriptional regulator [Candidatus Cloacimonadota bacterium]